MTTSPLSWDQIGSEPIKPNLPEVQPAPEPDATDFGLSAETAKLACEMTLPVEIQAAAGRGWRMFPCKPHGKEPLVKGWQQRASCDIAQLQAWAEHKPEGRS